jgi:hypothetical protein
VKHENGRRLDYLRASSESPHQVKGQPISMDGVLVPVYIQNIKKLQSIKYMYTPHWDEEITLSRMHKS